MDQKINWQLINLHFFAYLIELVSWLHVIIGTFKRYSLILDRYLQSRYTLISDICSFLRHLAKIWLHNIHLIQVHIDEFYLEQIIAYFLHSMFILNPMSQCTQYSCITKGDYRTETKRLQKKGKIVIIKIAIIDLSNPTVKTYNPQILWACSNFLSNLYYKIQFLQGLSQ